MTDTFRKIKVSEHRFDQAELLATLDKFLGDNTLTSNHSFIGTPVVVSDECHIENRRLCTVLNHALRGIVLNYFNDQRIRAIYALDDEMESILKIADKKGYSIGMYRPDFLYDESGQSKICEIGCRYPANGWMLSRYTTDSFTELLGLELQNDASNDFVEFLYAKLNSAKKLFRVHGKEKGNEIHYLLKELKERGLDSSSILFEDLKWDGSNLSVEGIEASQFILEIDREELKNVDPTIIKGIVNSDVCINDLRSTILVHDKRTLAVLYDKDIMLDYISEEDYSFLSKFLIPSYSVNSKTVVEKLIMDDTNWIVKPNSGGRGQGIYIKSDCDSETWNKLVRKDGDQFLAQHFVTQQKFQIPIDNELKELNLVGLMLCYDDQFFGNGLFRGAEERIINVYQNRGVIIPNFPTELVCE